MIKNGFFEVDSLWMTFDWLFFKQIFFLNSFVKQKFDWRIPLLLEEFLQFVIFFFDGIKLEESTTLGKIKGPEKFLKVNLWMRPSPFLLFFLFRL